MGSSDGVKNTLHENMQTRHFTNGLVHDFRPKIEISS